MFKSLGRLDEAVACLREALALRPNHAATYSNLGEGLCQQGLWDDALACYRKALDLDPGLELPIDSSAAIRTAGLLGDQFVSLEPGAEDELLAPGEIFTFTESALSLDELVGRLVHGDAFGDE